MAIDKATLQELRRLREAATPGPLTDNRGDGSMGTISTVIDDVQIAQMQSLGIRPLERDHAQRNVNARYLVALWNAAPAMLERLAEVTD